MYQKNKIFVILVIISLIGITTMSVFIYTNGLSPHNTVTNQELASYTIPSNAIIEKNNNTIKFNSSNVFLLIEGGPMNAPSMYSFEIYGLYNPTILVPAGSKITILFVNVDTDQPHNVAISRYLPQYYGMMGSEMMVPYAFAGSGCPVLEPLNSQNHYSYEFSFTANIAGNFYYLCQVPGHAENGMYGSFIVY
ncbi:MAG: sulfocyanin-like copper-binding protein [Thermoplasmata archaeon]